VYQICAFGTRRQGRHLGVDLVLGERVRLVPDQAVGRESAAGVLRPGDELQPLAGVEPLDALLTVGVDHLDGDTADVEQVVVDPPAEVAQAGDNPAKRLHRGAVLVRRVQDQLLAELEQPRQLASFEDAALAVLPRHDDRDLERCDHFPSSRSPRAWRRMNHSHGSSSRPAASARSTASSPALYRYGG
jgi:hypothetical protein